MAKKTCPSVPKSTCASAAAAATVMATTGCENKRQALAILRTALAQDTAAGRISASAASDRYAKAATSASTSCRFAERRSAAQKAREEAAKAALEREQREVDRFNGLGRGLFGLGLFGL
jgi:hypothetical protein